MKMKKTLGDLVDVYGTISSLLTHIEYHLSIDSAEEIIVKSRGNLLANLKLILKEIKPYSYLDQQKFSIFEEQLNSWIDYLNENYAVKSKWLRQPETLKQLQKDQESFKKAAISQAQESFDRRERELKQTIQERDVQLTRFTSEIESLKKQLSQSQSELKGEAGEIDLHANLSEAFPGDAFRRQKRGTSSVDIIQQIRVGNTMLDIPIVYDNKAANTVTKKDIEKAKKYQKIHGTNYVIIVSANLPKTSAPNGLFCRRDGILLVHPSIVVEVSRQIRSGIMEISKLSSSRQDRNTKEAKLYEYVISSEFSLLLEDISQVNEKLYTLQTKEEKDHQTLWKSRKDLVEQLVMGYNDLSSGIESIIQTESLELQEIQK